VVCSIDREEDREERKRDSERGQDRRRERDRGVVAGKRVHREREKEK
jgi:hypothetical protein